MSTTNHTPGPWFTWAPTAERWPRHTIRAAGEQYVAEVVIHAHNPASADAALIAAAPSMLEDGRELLAMLGQFAPNLLQSDEAKRFSATLDKAVSP